MATADATSTDDPERNRFIRAILDAPADDLPRQVFADWLEEHGENERAEFIRVQLEIGDPVGKCDRTGEEIGRNKLYRFRCRCRQCSLRRKELDLLGAHHVGGRVWKDGLEFIPNTYWVHENIGDPALPIIERERRAIAHTWRIPGLAGTTADYRRGFVCEIRLSLAAFVGGGCPNCFGTGDGVGPLVCSTCHGTGDSEGYAAAIFREHPVERVVLTDREPRFGVDGFVWFNRDHRSELPWRPGDLPSEFFARCRLDRVFFQQKLAALEWASQEAVAYGRAKAKEAIELAAGRRPNSSVK